jgi:hypothetical protein
MQGRKLYCRLRTTVATLAARSRTEGARVRRPEPASIVFLAELLYKGHSGQHNDAQKRRSASSSAPPCTTSPAPASVWSIGPQNVPECRHNGLLARPNEDRVISLGLILQRTAWTSFCSWQVGWSWAQVNQLYDRCLGDARRRVLLDLGI